VLGQLPNRAAWVASTARSRFVVHIDPRSGTATNILGAVPLIPGDGVGNDVTPDSLGAALRREVTAVDQGVVAVAARAHVVAYSSLLGIDVSQLGEARATAVNPELWQVSIPQVVKGVPVRYVAWRSPSATATWWPWARRPGATSRSTPSRT